METRGLRRTVSITNIKMGEPGPLANPSIDILQNAQEVRVDTRGVLSMTLASTDDFCKSLCRSDFSHEGGFGW